MTTGGVQVPDPSQPPHPCSQATADLLSVSVEQMGSFWSLAELGRCPAALTQRAASGRLHDVVRVSPSSLPPPQWHSAVWLQFVACLSVRGHFDCFQFQAIVREVATNVHVLVRRYVNVSWG